MDNASLLDCEIFQSYNCKLSEVSGLKPCLKECPECKKPCYRWMLCTDYEILSDEIKTKLNALELGLVSIFFIEEIDEEEKSELCHALAHMMQNLAKGLPA